MSQLGYKAGVVQSDVFARMPAHATTVTPQAPKTRAKMNENPVRYPRWA